MASEALKPSRLHPSGCNALVGIDGNFPDGMLQCFWQIYSTLHRGLDVCVCVTDRCDENEEPGRVAVSKSGLWECGLQ